MASFTKLDPQTHYSIVDQKSKSMIGWMWGFAALTTDHWPVGAKAFKEDCEVAVDVARSTRAA